MTRSAVRRWILPNNALLFSILLMVNLPVGDTFQGSGPCCRFDVGIMMRKPLPTTTTSPPQHQSCLFSGKNDDSESNIDETLNKENDDSESSPIDNFLDKPFFDPAQVTEDDPLPVRWFADLVQNNYETAEGLYVGAIFVVLVIASQELLRMQLYGDGYVPFQAGVRPGQLF